MLHLVQHFSDRPEIELDPGDILAVTGLTEAQVGIFQYLYQLAREEMFSGLSPDLQQVTGDVDQTLAGFVAAQSAAWQ